MTVSEGCLGLAGRPCCRTVGRGRGRGILPRIYPNPRRRCAVLAVGYLDGLEAAVPLENSTETHIFLQSRHQLRLANRKTRTNTKVKQLALQGWLPEASRDISTLRFYKKDPHTLRAKVTNQPQSLMNTNRPKTSASPVPARGRLTTMKAATREERRRKHWPASPMKKLGKLFLA